MRFICFILKILVRGIVPGFYKLSYILHAVRLCTSVEVHPSWFLIVWLHRTCVLVYAPDCLATCVLVYATYVAIVCIQVMCENSGSLSDQKVLQQSSEITILKTKLDILRKQHRELINIHIKKYKSQRETSNLFLNQMMRYGTVYR